MAWCVCVKVDRLCRHCGEAVLAGIEISLFARGLQSLKYRLPETPVTRGTPVPLERLPFACILALTT